MNIQQAIQQNQRLYGLNNVIVKLHSNLIQPQKEDKEKTKNKKQFKINKKKMNKSTAFMAFSKGKESIEPVESKRYIGFGVCNIVAINPNKAQLEKIYGRSVEKEPVYIGETEVDGVKVPQVRIDILYKLDSEKYRDDKGNPIDTVFRKSYFLTKIKQSNRDNTKFHIMDEYGNTAWATEDEVNNHSVPMYSNGPAGITNNYKVLYRGEENLTNLFKTFLGVTTIRINNEGQPTKYNNATKSWEVVSTESAEDGLCRFDNVDDYFKGDFKELNKLLSYQPNNKIKVLFGIKHVDGKSYQDIYDVVMYPNQTNISKFEKDFNNALSAGAYANTDFKLCSLREYTVESTDFDKTAVPTPNPFESNYSEDIFA